MAKFTVHLDTALKLIPHLVLRPQAFSVQSVSPLTVAIEHPDQDWVIDTINLLCRKDPTIKATQTVPDDLREGFEPASNLNLWEDATHQITFDGGKHWTNVIRDEGDPEYYVACSDGKRSWKVERFPADQVVKRPEEIHVRTSDGDYTITPPRMDGDRIIAGTITGRISDPQPQQIEKVYGGARGGKVRGTPNGLTVKPCPYRHPPTAVCPHCQDWERKSLPFGGFPSADLVDSVVHCTAHVDYDPASRVSMPDSLVQTIKAQAFHRRAASVGEQAFQPCGFLDTEFDSDPSVVGE